MRKTTAVWICMLILLAVGVMAVNPHTTQSLTSGGIVIENPKAPYWAAGVGAIDFYFHVYNSTGQAMSAPSTNCTVDIYNKTDAHVLWNVKATMEGVGYHVEMGDNITTVPGIYPYIIQCSNAKEAGFISDYFEMAYTSPQDQTAGSPLTALILVPLLFGILLLVGSFMFGEEHAVLKIALFLIAYLTVFLSLWFGIQVVVRYYGFADLQEAIGTTVWIIGIIFFVIVSYFLIYAFIQGVEAAAQKRKKVLEY